MTRQELLDKGFTEEQATIYLNDFHSINNSKKELEDKLAKVSTKDKELEELKAQIDAINKEKMTEQEKIELLKKETEENHKKSAIILNKAEVKTILAGTNIAEELIDTIVSSDKDKSIANANALLASITSLKETVEKQTRETITNANVKPTPGNTDPNNSNAMTWETFKKLSLEEQAKFAEEKPEEFAKF